MIHHTDCGMVFFTDEVIRGLLASSLETAALGPDGFHDVGPGPGSAAADYIDWLTIRDQEAAVAADVQRIRDHPLVPSADPGLWLRLRRSQRQAHRGPCRHPPRARGLIGQGTGMSRSTAASLSHPPRRHAA